MPKLCQVLAIEKGIRNTQNQVIGEFDKQVQKPALFAGISRTYRPKEDGGEVFPSEGNLVQARADMILKKLAASWGKLINIVATKDTANQAAKANVEVDGKVLLADVSVPTLLFLEKQLVDLHTVLKRFPTLDPSEEWTWSEAQNAWVSRPTESVKSKKIPKVFEKAPATKEHPAQVEVVHEDIIQGFWKAIKYSGALQATRVVQLLERVEALQVGVKFAREQANTVDAPEVTFGQKIFDYLLAA